MTIAVDSSSSKHSLDAVLEERISPWNSLYICVFLQFTLGVQIAIYFMSMWPYLSQLDSSASVDFLGWVVASCSFGCSVANPLFGYWNEKTMSVTWPVLAGFLLIAGGQLLYGLLPLFAANQKWIMIIARVVTGFGTGSISVLRAYMATAAVPQDRLRVISFGTAGYVLGLSFGPVIQALFTPLTTGWTLGPLVLNMFTLPAFLMVFITVLSCPVVWFFLEETYSGVIDKKDQEDNNIVLPDYDLLAALVCIWNWVVVSMVATNLEVMSTPLSTVMYDWNDSTSILYNGIMQCVQCLISVGNYFIIGSTRIGKIDKRKQILFGLSLFILYHVLTFPWPFYPGPLHYIPTGNTTAEIGGCDSSYSWCAHSVAIPLPLYVFCFVVLQGLAFPYVASPSASLYSEILGPRPQGTMQGMYSFGGSVAQVVGPLLSTYLFKHSGYLGVNSVQLFTLGFAVVLILTVCRRLVPLQLKRVNKLSTRA